MELPAINSTRAPTQPILQGGSFHRDGVHDHRPVNQGWCVFAHVVWTARSNSARCTDRRATQSTDTRAGQTFIAEVVARVASTGGRDAAQQIPDLLAEQTVAALVTARARRINTPTRLTAVEFVVAEGTCDAGEVVGARPAHCTSASAETA